MNSSRAHRLLTLKIRPMYLLAVLPGLYYLGNLIRLMNISMLPYYLFMAAAGVAGLAYALGQKKYNVTYLVLFFTAYIVTLAFNWLIVRNNSISTIASNFLLLGIALLLLLDLHSLKFGAFVFYTSAVMILYRMFTSGRRRILTSSANYISIAILLPCALYYMALEKEKGEVRFIDLLPAVIAFNISIMAEGRGGILSCLVLLIAMLLLHMRTLAEGRKRRTVIFVLIFLLAAVILYMRNFSLVDTFLGLGKYRNRGISTNGRMTLWRSYYEGIRESAAYILFGGPVNRIQATANYGGNTHNSFIQLHAYNGLVMLLIVAIASVRAAVSYIREKQFITLTVLLVIILRGMTDKYIFGQYGMPIFLFLILAPMVRLRRRGAPSAGTDAVRPDGNGEREAYAS